MRIKEKERTILEGTTQKESMVGRFCTPIDAVLFNLSGLLVVGKREMQVLCWTWKNIIRIIESSSAFSGMR